MDLPSISVCICTCRRTEWLRRLLAHIARQRTSGLFSFSVVVVDNDAAGSARAIVEAARSEFSLHATYAIEPLRNIAQVRNRTLEHASGSWIAFVDDDEFPVDDWLEQLFKTASRFGADGVLGPVRPHFDESAPSWTKKSGLYDRQEYPTGHWMQWRDCRTGNVLFNRNIINNFQPPFDLRFPNGGEDQDFFRRLMEGGRKFVWCNEAVVYETVPPARWRKSVLVRRALLRGKNTVKHADLSLLSFAKSLLAVTVYAVALPIARLGGMHLFMRYLVKLCDHLGKLLAALGMNPIRQRAG